MIIVGSNVAWLIYESQFETVTEEQTITQEQLELYVSLTKDFILDSDAKEGKVFKYFMM